MNTAPDGYFYLTHYQGRTKWFVRDNKKTIYIPKNKRDLAKRLAIKRYNSEQLTFLQRERDALSKYLLEVDNHIKNDKKLNDPGYMELLKESKTIEYLNKDIVWKSDGASMNNKYPEQLKHKTKSGHLVRSKSEVLIDNILYDFKLEYRYEHELLLGDIVVYPDFTIIHPASSKRYILEHFGLFDNAAYRNRAYEKLDLYARNNIFPGDNLLLTYETKDSPINIAQVSRLIEDVFINY